MPHRFETHALQQAANAEGRSKLMPGQFGMRVNIPPKLDETIKVDDSPKL
jgi:hypothetical protein